MKTLNDLVLGDNTLVMFSSDNGPEVTSVINMRKDYGNDGARPWRGMKRDNWEGGHRVPMIARWPGRIKAGSLTDQPFCLTDVTATCAAVVEADLPNDAAEDSFNFLPVSSGDQPSDQHLRKYTLHQTISLALAIRHGPWKYLDHQGSGGNNCSRPRLKPFRLKDTASGVVGQLYSLATDPGETTSLHSEHPKIVKELKSKPNEFRSSGRSAPAR